MKKKFIVELQETNYKTVEIEAEDFSEAAQLAGDMYADGTIIMDTEGARLDAQDQTDPNSQGAEIINIF